MWVRGGEREKKEISRKIEKFKSNPHKDDKNFLIS